MDSLSAFRMRSDVPRYLSTVSNWNVQEKRVSMCQHSNNDRTMCKACHDWQAKVAFLAGAVVFGVAAFFAGTYIGSRQED
jgi:hypothetical protein